MLKAKVFISCGQLTQFEKDIGNGVVEYFEKKGFEPYFAEDIHSPLALTQSIYDNLRTSEYFVCINFIRDDTDSGSLFVQQELAIASYNKIPLVAFHQPSIKLKGVAKYLHINSIKFDSLIEIKSNLDKTTKLWDPISKNQFKLSFGHEHLNVVIKNQGNILSNWYHIVVENLSSIFIATNCYSFVESIFDCDNKKEIFNQNEYKNELIWSGTGRMSVNIPYKAKKDIDAIFTIHKTGIWIFQETNTSTLYKYPTLKDGHYRIIYVIHSDNFPEAKIEVELIFINNEAKLIKEQQIK